jgi:hypothetical protein
MKLFLKFIEAIGGNRTLTFCLEGRRSTVKLQPHKKKFGFILERRAGIEPAFAQGGSPMCDMDSGGYRSTYTPHQVGQAGIEPATQGFSVPCSTD